MQPSVLAKVLILTAFSGWLVSIVSIPIVRWAAKRIGLVDRPDPTRKLHGREIALGGGIAVFLATAFVVALCSQFFLQSFAPAEFGWDSRWLALLCSSAAMLALGVVDDRFALRGKQKLLVQLAIVVFLVTFWNPSGEVIFLGWTLDLGSMTLPVVVFWLLASINAVNLIDGADGAAGSFAVVSSLGIACCAFIFGHVEVAVVAMAFGASLAGFLCFNRPPASIFLGDAGSMLIGLVLGTLACWAVERPDHPQNLLMPIALLGVPLFDSLVAILRRVLTGRSIYMPDRGHLHHTLQAHFKAKTLSPMWMIIAFGGLSSLTAAGAVVGAVFKSDSLAMIAMLFLMLGLVWSRLFGHAEARLLASHTRRVGGSIVSKVRRSQPKSHNSGVALQGTREWDGVWEPLVEFADKNNLYRLKLDINMPWRHEGYHGLWTHGETPEREEQWSVRLPIICQSRNVGRLEVVGKSEGTSQFEALEAFSFLISELQPEIERMVHCLSVVHDQHPAAPRRPAFSESATKEAAAVPATR